MTIEIPNPEFNSSLTESIIELERFRARPLFGDAEIWEFVELKSLFHLVEAISSARIEGNRTTIVEYIQNSMEPKNSVTETDDGFLEIINLQKALEYIDETIRTADITPHYIRDIQKIIVNSLDKEGDKNAGAYRKYSVQISGAKHTPPQAADIRDYMDELFEFVNNTNFSKQNDLLRIAIAHHRFTWIHPFGNGNGRTARMLTYAMLCKYGFILPNELRLYNPTSVFANNRNKYYEKLEYADDLDKAHILDWCNYFVSGLLSEIEKSHKLTDRNFIQKQILTVAISNANSNGILSDLDYKILNIVLKKGFFGANDIANAWDKLVSSQTISTKIRELKNRQIITQNKINGRKYHLRFTNNILTYSIMEQLSKNGLLPISLTN